MKAKLTISFCMLIMVTFGQSRVNNDMTIEELSEALMLTLTKTQLYKVCENTLRMDSSVYVLFDHEPDLVRPEPFEHEGIQLFLWNSTEHFFNGVDPEIKILNSISSWAGVHLELLTRNDGKNCLNKSHVVFSKEDPGKRKLTLQSLEAGLIEMKKIE